MIELVQLQQLIAVSEFGTISAAADSLHLSQPALTRSIQRMEKELGVTLFDRKRNRAVLNPVGEQAVSRAQAILDSVADLAVELQIFAARRSTIAIGACAPAPLWDLAAELSERFPEKRISTEFGSAEKLLERLESGQYHLILTDAPVERKGILCRRYTVEQLAVALPRSHPLSGRKTLFLSELRGESILAYRDMGIWKSFLEKNPQVRYLEQSDRDVLDELVRASDLPCFSSNLSFGILPASIDRVRVPLSDEEAFAIFYLCARETDRALLQQLC